ncbi:MAG: hypothetical protein KAS17_03235, partial [Victivallaceae bacterium]|nr:hypothetical protein [Victivallaceae bacterium]
YVGALSPCYHTDLVNDADGNYEKITVNDEDLFIYRDKRMIWNKERTAIVFVSKKLKAGQAREIYRIADKCKKRLNELNESLKKPRCKKYKRQELIDKIDDIIDHNKIKNVFSYTLTKKRKRPYEIEYQIDDNELKKIDDTLGFRIIMTNRHEWKSCDIIKSYYGQSVIEHAFKNIKNPFHISLRPNFHWTDQKIKVHAFCCVLGYTLCMLLWKTIREKTDYKGNLDNLLDALNDIRLAIILNNEKKKIDVNYQLEALDEKEEKFMESLSCLNVHKRKMQINGISVYK